MARTSRKNHRVVTPEYVKPQESKDCFVSDCKIADQRMCPGIPGSGKCAICRLKKNMLLGIGRV